MSALQLSLHCHFLFLADLEMLKHPELFPRQTLLFLVCSPFPLGSPSALTPRTICSRCCFLWLFSLCLQPRSPLSTPLLRRCLLDIDLQSHPRLKNKVLNTNFWIKFSSHTVFKMFFPHTSRLMQMQKSRRFCPQLPPCLAADWQEPCQAAPSSLSLPLAP